MSRLRHDPLHDTWVIIAPDRERRPQDVRLQVVPDPGALCPFCPGNERETPPEILATGRAADQPPDRPPWRVRVFPNRYPAVTGEEGRHEVIVLGAAHGRGLAALSPGEIAEALAALQQRFTALEGDPALASVLFFLNAGAGAGASLTHPHGQILATGVVPVVLRTELAAAGRWRAETGRCLLCDLAVDAERDRRIVLGDDLAVAWAPRASRFAWELLVAPRGHQARFAGARADELGAVARTLGGVCRALRAVAGDPPYNLVLHTAPVAVEDFHWHLELLPRLAPLAGFETGTGFHINPVGPETAAEALRRAVAAAAPEETS
ncbi:MAG TPA: DUF4921 family protein [Candidatus Krumholzibacteria bacterium]|nr:DUF4921 family protein [Candidatus Krumholzibacteria bacterium]HPD70944.1 DUF4921 family protein [Candidatus Krumholzibacteria bacterium]HRY39356.1 DUF4921 family protein [Candidatus Krumholzibacteria bacterium]